MPDLQQEMILRAPPGWGTRAIVDATLGATRSAFEVANYALMASLVRAGFATTLTPDQLSAVTCSTACALSQLTTPDAVVLSAAVCTDRRMSAATAVVLDALTRGSAARALEHTPEAPV